MNDPTADAKKELLELVEELIEWSQRIWICSIQSGVLAWCQMYSGPWAAAFLVEYTTVTIDAVPKEGYVKWMHHNYKNVLI